MEKKDGKRANILSNRRPEQILEAQLSWIASLVLFFSTVYTVIELDVMWVAFGITAISLYMLPIVTMRDVFKALPWEMTLLLAAPILLHISSGSQSLSERFVWWDDFTSMAFAFSLATIGFLLTVELQMYTNVRMNRPFAVFFVVMFTLSVSGLWQIGEFIGDRLYGTHYQGSNYDVMTVLLLNLIGGILIGFVYDAYLKVMPEKRRQILGFIHLYEVRKWRNG